MTSAPLQTTPLNALHKELGARMVAFAGYEMPVQYGPGLMKEHMHAREKAALFDVSHMGQLQLQGADTAAALEALLPVDVLGLGTNCQRYGLLLNDEGGILDDLMLVNRGEDFLVIVNGACKAADLAWIESHIGRRCEITALPQQALLALQGSAAVAALQREIAGVDELVFMTGGWFDWNGSRLYITRSGYTGEDGFEISLPGTAAENFARALLRQPEVQPAGLGARNSLRLEAGLCLYGNDIDTTTTPAQAALGWSIQKVRRHGGGRAGGFPGAARVLDELASPASLERKRVGLLGLERVPVREHCELQDPQGRKIGTVSSGLLSPCLNRPVAMAVVPTGYSSVGTRIQAVVRGNIIPMEVASMPFVPHRYHRA